MNFSPKIAFDRKTTLLFVIFATFLFCLVAWFTRYGGLALKTVPNYSDWERNTISSFLGMALVAGTLFPSIALLVWGRQQQPREILGSYLSVLLVQVATEAVFAQVFFSSITVIIGTVYTAFRIGQLWQSQQLLTTSAQLGSPSRQIFLALVWLLLIFWFLNLVMLLVVGWPNIL